MNAPLSPMCLSMYLVLSQIVTQVGGYRTPQEDNFYSMAEQRFQAASREELLRLWHTDCHRRCRWVLPRHIELACRFDPYRMENTMPEERKRRSVSSSNVEHERKVDIESFVKRTNKTITLPPSELEEHQKNNPFLNKADATNFFKKVNKPLSRQKRGITEECCFEKPCSWEEYGEYCLDYVRGWYVRPSTCS